MIKNRDYTVCIRTERNQLFATGESNQARPTLKGGGGLGRSPIKPARGIIYVNTRSYDPAPCEALCLDCKVSS